MEIYQLDKLTQGELVADSFGLGMQTEQELEELSTFVTLVDIRPGY